MAVPQIGMDTSIGLSIRSHLFMSNMDALGCLICSYSIELYLSLIDFLDICFINLFALLLSCCCCESVQSLRLQDRFKFFSCLTIADYGLNEAVLLLKVGLLYVVYCENY